ncbi:hypothetical protein BS47DRAFT_1374460 [Hydnum rufescens UP504]|uniref:ATP-dependent RNA helicase n=1 Tax=Hydnum rufescens UP504 TaxID=1448309 RepID=A0A9P6AEL8_9AGAM|nr:hypothetical protein BS47DRAFT_1374460 [Hydnum rufescens UP504]
MDDGIVLNLAPDFAVDRTNPRRIAQKGGRWTDRVKAKRVAKRKNDSADVRVSPTTEAATPRPAKRPRIEILPPTRNRPTQIISSLFSYNPSVPVPQQPRPRPIARPTNAPLTDASAFLALGLDPLLVAHLKNKMSISTPTSVQRASISTLLGPTKGDSADVFIQSQTGSGKTLAFLLPIIQDLLPLSTLSYIDRSIGTLAIIIVPTRELANQISQVLESLLSLRLRPDTEDGTGGEAKRLTRWLVSGVLTGGATRTHEKARLRKGLPILVSTPGRLLDHLQNTESFNVGKCRWLVLDEADRLMELGFEETITGIIKSLDGRRRLAARAAAEGILVNDAGGWDWTRRRRTVLCSATIRDDVEKLAGTTLQNPIVVNGSELGEEQDPVSTSSSTAFTPPAQLAQKYVTVPLKLRLVALIALLRSIIQLAPPPGRSGVCTDSVDFHWKLFGGVRMGAHDDGPEPTDQSDSDGEPGDGSDAPEDVKCPLLPGTSIFRLHGSLPLATRLASLRGFNSSLASDTSADRKVKTPAAPKPSSTSAILLCTSVASRGLDLPLVRAVIQYDLPTENGAHEYVHRVGRTARAGKGGEAWSFVAPSEAEWVPWIENNMSSGGGRGDHTSGVVNPPQSPIKLEAVAAQDLLKRGFGGNLNAFEDRATQVQLAFEQWVLRSKENTNVARRAFQSHMRAYATHPSSEKHIFHVRNLHMGHLAKAFALRDAPSAIGSASASASGSGSKAPHDTGKGKNRDKKKPGRSKTDDTPSQGEGGEEKEKGAMHGETTTTATDRMRKVVRDQGRLTKQDGAMGAAGTDEFQIAGGLDLEALVHGRRNR